MSLRDYDDDSGEWCNVHAVSRERCRCRPHHGLSDEAEAWNQLTLHSEQLVNLPQPAPLIDGTLDQRTVAMLTAPWGVGKTFLALDWALCIASGKPWQARTVARKEVLYIAAEGAYGLYQRISAWETAWKQEADVHFLPRPIRLGTRQIPGLCEYLRDYLGCGLVVVDTLARCMVGKEENSAADMGPVIEDLFAMRDAISSEGGTVLVIHHTGKDGKTSRGSSALEAAMDTVYQIDGDSQSMRLHRTKRKDGPTPDSLGLRLQPVPGTDSAVVSTGRVDMTPTQDRLVSTFVQAFSESGATKAELRTAAEMSSGSFHRALNRALQQGFLVNVGTEQRPFYRLGGGMP